MKNDEIEIKGLFSTPVYLTKSPYVLNDAEMVEINTLLSEGIEQNRSNHTSLNHRVLDSNLPDLRKYLEENVKLFAGEVFSILPRNRISFYITQSWLSITKPGEFHHVHSHPNSVISGVYYVNTVENDGLVLHDPNFDKKYILDFGEKNLNHFNAGMYYLPVSTGQLVLFPSWLKHSVDTNPGATTNRISLAFNVFVRGGLGKEENLTHLNVG